MFLEKEILFSFFKLKNWCIFDEDAKIAMLESYSSQLQ